MFCRYVYQMKKLNEPVFIQYAALNKNKLTLCLIVCGKDDNYVTNLYLYSF